MAKEIKYSKDARGKMLEGVNKLGCSKDHTGS